MSRAAGQTLEHDGCRLHYWVEGPAGAPLVAFSHGATADHTMFDEQVGAVTRRYRMLRWDMRGQGLSRPARPSFSCTRAADDLRAILDHLGERSVALVGQSIGGNVGQAGIHFSTTPNGVRRRCCWDVPAAPGGSLCSSAPC